MAELMEMSVRGYSDIERGATDVPFLRLEQIAEKLGVQVSDILVYGDRVSNFFEQCSNTNIATGSNGKNGNNETNHNYDNRELQHQIEKLQLELKLCQAEKEKAELEARYWREKNEEEQK